MWEVDYNPPYLIQHSRRIFLVLTFVAILVPSTELLGVSLFLFAYFSIFQYYYLNITKGLIIKNNKSIRYMKVGEDGNLSFHIVNKGMPIIYSQLRFQLPQTVKVMGISMVERGEMMEYSLPFFIGKDEEKIISIPIETVMRGKASFQKIELLIPHFYGPGRVIATYKENLREQLTIFPKHRPIRLSNIRSIQGDLEEVHTPTRMGSSYAIGVREYEVGDSIKQINWRNSARLQKLQTNLFPNHEERSVTLLLNIHKDYSLNGHIEEFIEWITFMISQLDRDAMFYSLAISVQSEGVYPFMYVDYGNGKRHRLRCLEYLGGLSSSHVSVPMDRVIDILMQKQQLKGTIIYIGHETNNINSALRNCIQSGIEVKKVSSNGNELEVVVPWS